MSNERPDDLGLLGLMGDLVVLEAEGLAEATVGHSRRRHLVYLRRMRRLLVADSLAATADSLRRTGKQ